MKPPYKPIEPRYPTKFNKTLPNEGYTIHELLNIATRFATEHGGNISNVSIGYDQTWTDYEECEVSLFLSIEETKKSYNKRVASYKSELEKYNKEKEEYKKFCEKQEAENIAKKKEKRKSELLEKIKELSVELDKIK